MGLSGNRIGYPMLPPIPMDMFFIPIKIAIWIHLVVQFSDKQI